MSNWDIRFLNLAKLVSTWAKDPSTKTGAVIVHQDKTIVSLGFNGFPKNMYDAKQHYENRDEKYSRIIHAEMNALLFAKSDVKDCTLYTYPFISCDRCFVHLAQVGITKIVSIKPTEERLTRWGKSFDKTKRYAKECGVEIIEYDEKDLSENNS